MEKKLKICACLIISSLSILPLLSDPCKAEGEIPKPPGEIRVVENWRPDMNVLGHINVFVKQSVKGDNIYEARFKGYHNTGCNSF
jgi:hypothetical protein